MFQTALSAVAGAVGGFGGWLWKRRRSNKQKRFRALTFTARGRIIVLLSLAVGFAALNTGQNLLFLVLGLCLALILLSGLLSEQNLRRLQISREHPQTLSAGQSALITLAIKNRRKNASFGIQVCDHIASDRLDETQEKRCYFLKLDARNRTQTTYRLECPHRGLYSFGPVELSTRFPFTFFTKAISRPIKDHVLVLPRILEIPLPPFFQSLDQGDQSTPKCGQEGDFYGLRDYRPGDLLHDIAWKRLTQTHKLLTRERESQTIQTHALVLNDRCHMPRDLAAEDRLIDRCASLCALLSRHARLTLTCSQFSCTIEPNGGGLEIALGRLALLVFSDDASWVYSGPPALALSLPGLEDRVHGPITLDETCDF